MSPSRPRSSLHVLVASVATWLLVCVAVASAHGGGFPGGHHADDAHHAWLHAQSRVEAPPDVPGERLREDEPRPHGKRLLVRAVMAKLAVRAAVDPIALLPGPAERPLAEAPVLRHAVPEPGVVVRGLHDPHSRRALGRAPPVTTRSVPTLHA
ncbi:hypothetical protein ACQQ2N_08355 [Dokdonella sp. MW10]|uniref:hypothetical protein n=1 Tax=Dokdonella sp. MW10 TaxID=2992926 RepID=UPI003F7F754F